LVVGTKGFVVVSEITEGGYREFFQIHKNDKETEI
jgi:hypothetical protein